MELSTIGILGVVGLLVSLAIGIPIGAAMALVGFVGFWVATGFAGALGLVGTLPYHLSTWEFVVIPMFVLMGVFASEAGIGRSAFRAAVLWVGNLRGGLLVSTTFACAAFGFASGSSLATASTFTTLALPETERYGYNRAFSCAAIGAAGTLAALIPPSGMMVIYSLFTDTSLGPLLIAGVIPGFLVAVLLVSTVYLRVTQRPDLAPPAATKVGLMEKVLAVRWLVPVAILAALILGGIYFGVFTPTEAGAVSALISFIMLCIQRRFHFKGIWQATKVSLASAVETAAMIFLIILGAFVFSRFLAITGLVKALSGVMIGLPVPPIFVVVMMMLVLLILGCFMEAVAMLALTMPIFFPVIIQFGFDPVWFGILVVMMAEIGILTPPVGTVIFVVQATARSIGFPIKLEQIFGALWPIVIAYLIAVLAILFYPPIALWLPTTMGK